MGAGTGEPSKAATDTGTEERKSGAAAAGGAPAKTAGHQPAGGTPGAFCAGIQPPTDPTRYHTLHIC